MRVVHASRFHQVSRQGPCQKTKVPVLAEIPNFEECDWRVRSAKNQRKLCAISEKSVKAVSNQRKVDESCVQSPQNQRKLDPISTKISKHLVQSPKKHGKLYPISEYCLPSQDFGHLAGLWRHICDMQRPLDTGAGARQTKEYRVRWW